MERNERKQKRMDKESKQKKRKKREKRKTGGEAMKKNTTGNGKARRK